VRRGSTASTSSRLGVPKKSSRIPSAMDEI
jgi:hypothetical protein